MGRHKIDETGKRYGRLVVISQAENPDWSKNPYALWLCKCDCGKLHTTRGVNLRNRHTTSCGCSKILPNGRAASHTLFLRYKGHATERNISWEISEEQFLLLTK